MDKIVFDIETKNIFADVGGEENIHKLEASVVGVYSYINDSYYCYDENEFEKLHDVFSNAGMLIGFSSKRFDVPVLLKYFNKLDISVIPHFDILEEIEKAFGRRIGLGVLAEANLGVGKSAHGLEAVEFYKKGEMKKLKDYCLQDVKITKEIFDLIKSKGHLWIPQRNRSEMIKLPIIFNENKFKSTQSSLF